eukprot:CAMPEP_0185757206 /NCGR_PEP_ID=MMETSP1174-20130828/15674_1 /TAXON_ID=35687 /ORGANISM="Dictyocha speculum, Strain CCMP1381" /LENGTH=178 /DNA_ID=CAMNT_0028436519 /DNA_START=65 /DNA_END=597 /DNA_ORIENTATION=+
MNTDLRNASVVSPVTIFLVAGLGLDIEPYAPPPIYDEDTGEELRQKKSYTVALDGWCKARMQPESAKAVLELRKCWSDVFDETVCGVSRGGRIDASGLGLVGIENVLTLEGKGTKGVSDVKMQRLVSGGGHGGDGYGGGGYGARPGDWICEKCEANVYASKSACFKCGTPKGAGGGGG